MTEEYVDLARTFHELSRKGDKDDISDYFSAGFGKALGWEDLLNEYRTLILSEAGSGKTEEIRHTAQTLRMQGKPAFFLRLEHIANDFEIAFEEGSLAEFSEWLASDEEGWLFLDSVDEARLRDPKDFEAAIRKIGTKLLAALQRVHIVLTSRDAAWRPVTDLKLCQKHLGYRQSTHATTDGESKPIDGKREDNHFRIVALDKLGRPQAEIFARAKGVVDAALFLDAIERADAWSMAARPDDLTELVAFWKKDNRIGNRLELMRSSISRRLTERDQDRAEALPLSPEDAMNGARCVAAAATMSHESTIRVPDGTQNRDGLAVASILVGWNDKKIAALLARPIFDDAIYQTVRFHHRTVREYLTAEWFKELLDRTTSRRKIEAVFFREQYGQLVIVPTMRPVLVWLILLDEKIRDRAISISPELIFEGGEPKVLPLELRQKILHEICEKMHTGVTRESAHDYRAIQRFAGHDIVADVKALFIQYAKNDSITSFLLRMVWQGEMAELLPESKELALDVNANRYTRVMAFRAVRAAGSGADMAEVRARFLVEARMLSRDWLAELLEDLPPTKYAVEWLLLCLAKLKPKDQHAFDGLPSALDRFIPALDLDELAMLLSDLEALIVKKPIIERRYCEISQRYGWLIKSATQAAGRLIVARHPTALLKPTLSILQKVHSAQHYRDWDLRDIPSEIPKLVPAWPELNDRLFWYSVAEARRFRAKKSERLTEFWQISVFGSYWKFDGPDFDRVLAEILARSTRDDRLVALSLAFRIYFNAQRPKKWRNALKKATAKSSVLRDALQNLLNPPPPSEEQKRWKKQEAEYRRRNKERALAYTKREHEWKDYLTNNFDKLRDPFASDPTIISNPQYYLHERMRSAESNSGHWTTGNWQSLQAEFGADISSAFRDGVVAFWRRYKPKLLSEGKVAGSTPFAVIFGLSGLSIEARETENWASTLIDHDAELAFRYAMKELNGVPDWMPSLFEAFPELMTKLLLREVDRDLRVEKVKVETHYVLADLSWSGSWAWSRIGPDILARLKAREPKNLTNLGYMLNIIHGADICVEDVARLAEIRSADRRTAHSARWFAVWAGVEPEKAIPAIDERLKTIHNPDAQVAFAMQFITNLLGGRHSETKIGDAFRTPTHLKSLYLLMHHYVRRKDDIRRAGTGVYSPGLRDDAQDGREQLFALLKEIPGKESYIALVELAKLHPEPSLRPWMLHHAKTKAEFDADIAPWTIGQTLEFQGALERTPANHRELFELAELRFLDLKDSLEHGDSSIADILIKGATQETEMRKYIGEWFRDGAQGRYSIPQEEELADAKRPDFRIHGNGFDGPVPAELKLADKWGGPDLFERLENQLCGDYLRDNRSNRGLFILVYRGEKQHWELPNGSKNVDFESLLLALDAHWQDISSKLHSVDDVRVVGIDLTLRSKRAKK